MFAHVKIKNLDDFFAERDSRPGRGVYFYRINGYTEEIGQFIQKYYEAARLSGVIGFPIRTRKIWPTMRRSWGGIFG